MTDKPPAKPSTDQADSKSKPKTDTASASRPAYISGGQVLSSPPLTARLSRFVDNAYNFFGLYFVSLLSLDPYAAAQNSNFNTAGPGRVSNRARAGWGVGVGGTGTGSGVGGSGPRGGGGGGGGGSGRRLGTVDDVRGPECGSCG